MTRVLKTTICPGHFPSPRLSLMQRPTHNLSPTYPPPPPHSHTLAHRFPHLHRVTPSYNLLTRTYLYPGLLLRPSLPHTISHSTSLTVPSILTHLFPFLCVGLQLRRPLPPPTAPPPPPPPLTHPFFSRTTALNSLRFAAKAPPATGEAAMAYHICTIIEKVGPMPYALCPMLCSNVSCATLLLSLIFPLLLPSYSSSKITSAPSSKRYTLCPMSYALCPTTPLRPLEPPL